MGIDASIEGRKVPPENIADQVFAADGAAGDTHQGCQKVEFHCREIYRLAVAPYRAGTSVQFDILDGNRRRGG